MVTPTSLCLGSCALLDEMSPRSGHLAKSAVAPASSDHDPGGDTWTRLTTGGTRILASRPASLFMEPTPSARQYKLSRCADGVSPTACCCLPTGRLCRRYLEDGMFRWHAGGQRWTGELEQFDAVLAGGLYRFFHERGRQRLGADQHVRGRSDARCPFQIPGNVLGCEPGSGCLGLSGQEPIVLPPQQVGLPVSSALGDVCAGDDVVALLAEGCRGGERREAGVPANALQEAAEGIVQLWFPIADGIGGVSPAARTLGHGNGFGQGDQFVEPTQATAALVPAPDKAAGDHVGEDGADVAAA